MFGGGRERGGSGGGAGGGEIRAGDGRQTRSPAATAPLRTSPRRPAIRRPLFPAGRRSRRNAAATGDSLSVMPMSPWPGRVFRPLYPLQQKPACRLSFDVAGPRRFRGGSGALVLGHSFGRFPAADLRQRLGGVIARTAFAVPAAADKSRRSVGAAGIFCVPGNGLRPWSRRTRKTRRSLWPSGHAPSSADCAHRPFRAA
jgi:hypothetical protein